MRISIESIATVSFKALLVGALSMSLPAEPAAAADVSVRIVTTLGEIVAKLHADLAPRTVGNFVTLARQGFYDGTIFHRVVPGYLVQGGDPLGNGTGGPGFCFADEIVPGLVHDKAGVLSMVSTGPDTSGSQFVITLGKAPDLDGRQPVFGEVTAGTEVLKAIDGSKARSGKPVTDIKIVSIQVVGAYAPGDLGRVKELSGEEMADALKAPVDDLLAGIGASLKLGKPTAVRFERGNSRCAEGQASYSVDFGQHRGAKLLVHGRATGGGFDVARFQFGKGKSL